LAIGESALAVFARAQESEKEGLSIAARLFGDLKK
jgi:hypothetical protein